MPFHTVAREGELQPGDIKPIAIGDTQLVLLRSGDRYFALQRRCLHAGGDLADGIVSRGHIVCAHHGWRFAVASGQHEMSPETCLRTFAVRIEGDEIQVDPTPLWKGELTP